MKHLLIGFLFVAFQSSAQPPSFGRWDFNDYPCGELKANEPYYTDWQTIDTLGKVVDTARDWVYNKEVAILSSTVNTAYCRCGCLEASRWEQWRVCKISGIRQRRYKIQTYSRIPPPKTEYERVVDSLSPQHTKIKSTDKK